MQKEDSKAASYVWSGCAHGSGSPDLRNTLTAPASSTPGDDRDPDAVTCADRTGNPSVYAWERQPVDDYQQESECCTSGDGDCPPERKLWHFQTPDELDVIRALRRVEFPRCAGGAKECHRRAPGFGIVDPVSELSQSRLLGLPHCAHHRYCC
jgi:hypothetical protein